MLTSWDRLPDYMKIAEVKPYYDILNQRRFSLLVKRVFDCVVALILLIILAVPMVIIAVWIKADSDGPVFYRQERVTKDGKHFKIHKFRTMVTNADQIGTAVTVNKDKRITRVGEKLRSLRLDELPQVFNVLGGSMSFVGTRPEVPRYVEQYAPEYYATLLLPAGVTSLASIRYKDEEKLLSEAENADETYIQKVLPEKMKYNLDYTRDFGFFSDIKLMFQTVFEVAGS